MISSNPRDILDRTWCVVPVYNNAGTVQDVVDGCLAILPNVLVVDDGSTDADLSELLADTGVTVLRHDTNRGKGAALLTALAHVRARGASYMIALDGDGQHFPSDIGKILPLLSEDEPVLVIGTRDFEVENIPRSSRFGRRFSNMWVRMETGLDLSDTQSGFRAYPVAQIAGLAFSARHYDFEIEVLTRAAWAGVPVKEVGIGVFYPEADRRTSSFRPFLDNLRISMMHTRLLGRRLLPLPHKQQVASDAGLDAWDLLKHPIRFITMLVQENASPTGLAAAAAVGSFLAVLPLVGVHTVVIIYVATRLHLNKPMAVAIQNLYMPPFVPFLCVEVGHCMRYGRWWRDFSWDSVVVNVHQRLYEWLLGSLILAPLYALIAGGAVYTLAVAINRRRRGAARSAENGDGAA